MGSKEFMDYSGELFICDSNKTVVIKSVDVFSMVNGQLMRSQIRSTITSPQPYPALYVSFPSWQLVIQSRLLSNDI